MPPPDPAPLVALAPCPAPACVAAPARRHARGGRAAGPAGGAAGRVRRGRAAPGGRRRRAAAATARCAGLGGRVRAPRRGGRAARARRRGAAARGVRAAAGAPPRGHAGAAASAHGPQEAQHARGAGTVHALHLRAIQGGVSCPLSGRVGLWLGFSYPDLAPRPPTSPAAAQELLGAVADLAWAPDDSEAWLLAAAPLRAGLRLSGAIGCLGASHESLLLSHGLEAVAAAAAAGAPGLVAGCAAMRPGLHVRACLALCAPCGGCASPWWTPGQRSAAAVMGARQERGVRAGQGIRRQQRAVAAPCGAGIERPNHLRVAYLIPLIRRSDGPGVMAASDGPGAGQARWWCPRRWAGASAATCLRSAWRRPRRRPRREPREP